ncbi:CRISPR-associated endonuclease Cas2 [uncultured Azohydromonas sp.]|jgi:Uncharacterized protein predicted to be involved in DNA repair|uniref:CRISPR-associated endonuclease Cas2 n=1 Tax=uncultured Azohydromonas sp. TaxID=487342 RepID=UPI0026258499|nr:CRISPR-associated endonuclease Cas2 [uncultured Azohydromonas sp.]
MTQRHLYLAAYDSSDARRRATMLRLLRGFTCGGQKSAYEVELSPTERRELLCIVAGSIDSQKDRFLLARLDPRGAILTAGRGAESSERSGCIYLG